MKVALVGDIVMFVGTDGKHFDTKLINFTESKNRTLMAVLSLQGKTETVEWSKIKWDGEQFIIDLREDIGE